MIVKPRSPHVAGELLVRLKPTTNPSSESNSPFEGIGEVAARYPLDKMVPQEGGFSESEILHLKLKDSSAETMESAISKLHQDGRVAYAVTNDHLFPTEVRPDDYHPELYGMERISAPQAWSDTNGDRKKAPLLAVIDSGTDYTHPDLAPNIWTNPKEVANGLDDDGNGVVDDLHGFDAVGKTGDPFDSGSHGTHVAGTVAAVGNNGMGVTGVAWQAQLMPCKFISGGFGSTADAIAALVYADSQGARITQNSWGGTNPNQALVDTLEASSALHICASGNSGQNSDIKPLFPAAYPLENILSVAATDREDQLASFSNFGADSVDLAAPGVDIYSTMPNSEYGHKSGTSMATPHVSGAASLILEKYPALSNKQLKERLMFSTDRLTQLEGKVVSGGRLNLAKALENDSVAPGPLQNLKTERVDTQSVEMSFLASGDDGSAGQAAAYEIAYSDKPFEPKDFEELPQVRTAKPKPSGGQEKVAFALTPSAEDRELFVGIRSVDNVGNRSELQTLKVAVPKAQVAFEGDSASWNTEGDWGQEIVEGRGPVWSDSPGRFYRRDQMASLTSETFNLQDFQNPEIQFECRHDLEMNFDKIFLEVRAVDKEGQGDWAELKSFNRLDGWHTEKHSLKNYAGQEQVQMRFRLQTDGDVFKDGFQFHRLVVAENTETTE